MVTRMDFERFSRWFNYHFWRAFKDRPFPLRMLNAQADREAILKKVYQAIISSTYAPSIPEREIILNKGHGVARTIPVFSVEDYCVYFFCIKELEPQISGNRTANTFGGWSLGGQIRGLERGEIEAEVTEYGRYSFNPFAWTKAFGEFNALLFSQLDQGRHSRVLQFDLANFYDSIRLDTLERWIREESDGAVGWVIALLFYFLNHWNRRNTGLHPQVVGLPQDALADCSRILANFYLRRYDKIAQQICEENNATYFRYADDQMILLTEKAHVEKILLLLTRSLDRFGLRVNQKKVHLWTTSGLYEHRCRDIQAIFRRPEDNKNAVRVRKFTRAYLAIPKRKLRATWNEGGPLLNRLVWAKLETLPPNLFEQIMKRLLADKYLLIADRGKLRRISDLNLLTRRPIAFRKRLERLGRACMHCAFHHEVIAFANEVGASDLRTKMQNRVAELEALVAASIVR